MSDTSNTPKKSSQSSFQFAFREIIWPRRGMLLGGLVMVAISRAAGLVLPYSNKIIFDEILPNQDLDLLLKLVIGVGIAILVQSITSFSLTRILSVAAQHMIADLRSRVQQHIIRLPIREFDNTKSGTMVSRIMTDVEGVRNLVGTGFTQLIGGLMTAIASIIIMIYLSPTLTLVSVVPLILFGVISFVAFGRIRPIFRERSVIQADVTGRLTESMGGVRVIKGFHAEEEEIRIFRDGVLKLFRNIKSSLTATAFVTSAGALLTGLASLAILGMGTYLIIEGQGTEDPMTAGKLLSFVFYLAFLIFPIVQMSNIGSQITEAFAGLDRTRELLEKPREMDDLNRTLELGDIQGNIEFRDVKFSYETGKEVLHGISFDAPVGSVTALVGSSGSGKTTIAGLAASFLNPDEGAITVDGHNISEVTLDSFRSNLGVVLQDDFLFEGTIRENILYARPQASEEELKAAVDSAYVSEFTDRFEEGLNTLIGERGVKLSGGQRQRIAIARAILADPRILILDEATSNLDTESETYIQRSLEKLMAGRTTFVIAHRLSTIRQADQILVIEQGNIAERGTHDELIAQKGRYYELFTYQSRI
ncbi:ABC transporter ATP-binding protein [Pontibacter sp. G13]|uniref:ABC transporter ATP-binding protein n=1 Tax=Pontibacter sp. G13 TaxID=3074898 RepID=UPI00288BD245|nr:ABC transporter ATP-binding protein [Pontibacter sp. G13]WNJ16132.1 ABC transporter ATP-binding protein [Pontibacter sp. G13]